MRSRALLHYKKCMVTLAKRAFIYSQRYVFHFMCTVAKTKKGKTVLKYTVYPQSCIIRNITNYRDFIVFTALAVHIGSCSLKCSQSADNSSALSSNRISENVTSIISCCVNFNLCKLTTPHHRMCVGKEKKSTPLENNMHCCVCTQLQSTSGKSIGKLQDFIRWRALVVTFLESSADPTTCQDLVVDYSRDFRTLLRVQGSNCTLLILPVGTCFNLEALLSWLHSSSFILHITWDLEDCDPYRTQRGIVFLAHRALNKNI